MNNLDKIKAIISRAHSDFPRELYSEIDASLVFEEDWIHIGEDHFYSKSRRLVAGPNAGGARVAITLAASIELPVTRDISHEWERQAGSGPSISPEEARDLDQPEPLTEKRRPSGVKCACDS